MTLCFATNNAHKLEEIQALLGGAFVLKTLQDIGCHEEIAETTNTIEGNSLQKAQHVWQNYQCNCFADDSGLEVVALGGAPGVDSAHYSGVRNFDINNALLLKNLAGITDRRAQFKTVITLILESQIWQFEGIVTGTITDTPRGTQGFGYDPLFLPDGHERTFAEMNLAEKSQLSHRSRAFQKLIAFLSKP
jgi:XTP/dITP diphosphohydrolase